MKKHLLYLCMASLMGMASCEDFNEHNFKGLEDMTTPENMLNKDYTLTTDDYTTISGLTVDGVESSDLKAVKSNQYLTPQSNPRAVLPVFLAKNWKTASLGATLRMTFNYVPEAPAYLSTLAVAGTYELTADDYKTVWGVKGKPYLSPSKSPVSNLPKVLKTAIAQPTEGDYTIVSYKYMANEAGSGDEGSYDKIEDAVAAGTGAFKVKGTVVATYKKGFLLSDGTASILVFLGTCENAIGDVVTVEGTVSEFNGMTQFPRESVVKKVEVEDYVQPVPNQWDAAQMDAYLTQPSIQYVTYIGTLKISGNYYNVNIEGATKAVGSIQYPMDGMVDAALNNQKVIVTGYTLGVSGNKYVNTMATSVIPVSDYAEIGDVIAAAEAGNYTVRGVVCGKYDRGVLLTDGTGYILGYLGSDKGFEVGDVVTVSGTTSLYGGFYQFPNNSVATRVAKSSYTYPQPEEMNAAALDAYLTNKSVKYITYTGTLSITANSSGATYYNVAVEGTATAIGSIQYPAKGVVDASLNNKKVKVTGYAIGVSGNRFINTMAVSVTEAAAAQAQSLTLASAGYTPAENLLSRSSVATRAAVVAETRYAVYVYEGTDWKPAENATIVNPADYDAMGEPGTHDNFSGSIESEKYLPQFLTMQYPYAQEGLTIAVLYNYYNGTETVVKADEYKFTEGIWKYNTLPVTVVTEQYALTEDGWVYSPDVTVTLVPGKNMGTKHFQALTDWVWENIDQKEGVTEKGKGYVTSYGNNDYYYGGSEYQNNFDFRPSAWKAQNEKAYSEISDEELNELMWERLPEGILHMLEAFYPEAKLEDVPVTYVVNFGIYGAEGSSGTKYYTIRYKLTGKGQFAYIKDSLKEISSL